MPELAALAARHGAHLAIRAPGADVTYAELAARVAAAAARLTAHGVAPLDRVALCCRPDVETIASALALLERPCTVLPVAAAAAGLGAALDSFAPAWEVNAEQVTPHAGARRAPAAPSAADAPLQALLSSGAAGRPKIVLRSAAQVQAGVHSFATAVRLAPADRVLLLVPLEHSFGFNSVMLGALSAGATIVVPRSRHPRGVAADIEASGTTLFPAPPLFFDWMCRLADARGSRLGALRACISVGDIVARATYEAFVARFGVALWQSYGASEAGPILLNDSGACGADTMALGRPYPGVCVELRDARGAAVRDGEVGEIAVQSPAVGLGYLGAHDAGSRFAGRTFHTGDLAVQRSGELHFAGRSKVLITRAGRKIDPGEIERVLCSHPAVIDAGVRVAGVSGHDALQALVVTRDRVAPEALIEHCARALEAHKVPRRIEFRPALPRDATGKLQREQLQTW
jgi:long-chain acyl-CoA synthetase